MKTTMKRIIAIVLCAVIAIASTGTNTAYAATSKPPLKIKFNGKSINMVRVLENGDEESASINEVLNKFGNPDKKQTSKDDGRYTFYTWKKGKSSITFSHYVDTEYDTDILCHFNVNLKGKNDALCGIKVGMKKAKAIKKLKKMFGNNNVCVAKEGQTVFYKNGKYVPKGKPTGNGEYISVIAYSYVLSLSFYLKNGQVSSMGFAS